MVISQNACTLFEVDVNMNVGWKINYQMDLFKCSADRHHFDIIPK